MTWAQLKFMVEEALIDSGQKDDIEIDYFDFSRSSAGVGAYVEEYRDYKGRIIGYTLTVQ